MTSRRAWRGIGDGIWQDHYSACRREVGQAGRTSRGRRLPEDSVGMLERAQHDIRGAAVQRRAIVGGEREGERERWRWLSMEIGWRLRRIGRIERVERFER